MRRGRCRSAFSTAACSRRASSSISRHEEHEGLRCTKDTKMDTAPASGFGLRAWPRAQSQIERRCRMAASKAAAVTLCVVMGAVVSAQRGPSSTRVALTAEDYIAIEQLASRYAFAIDTCTTGG